MILNDNEVYPLDISFDEKTDDEMRDYLKAHIASARADLSPIVAEIKIVHDEDACAEIFQALDWVEDNLSPSTSRDMMNMMVRLLRLEYHEMYMIATNKMHTHSSPGGVSIADQFAQAGIKLSADAEAYAKEYYDNVTSLPPAEAALYCAGECLRQIEVDMLDPDPTISQRYRGIDVDAIRAQANVLRAALSEGDTVIIALEQRALENELQKLSVQLIKSMAEETRSMTDQGKGGVGGTGGFLN